MTPRSAPRNSIVTWEILYVINIRWPQNTKSLQAVTCHQMTHHYLQWRVICKRHSSSDVIENHTSPQIVTCCCCTPVRIVTCHQYYHVTILSDMDLIERHYLQWRGYNNMSLQKEMCDRHHVTISSDVRFIVSDVVYIACHYL